MIKKLLCGVLMLLLIFMIGCQEQNNEPDFEIDIRTYTVTGSKYLANKYIITEGDKMSDFFDEQEQRRLEMRAEEEYRNKVNVWARERENDECSSEEAQIEAYCKENGYWDCVDITKTCDMYGCKTVTITCEDNDFVEDDLGDVCHHYDVQIGTKYYEDCEDPAYIAGYKDRECI